MIPVEYLSKMSGHCVDVQGVELKVKVVDLGTGFETDSLLTSYLNNMRSALNSGPRVVGVDVITRTAYADRSFVLCCGASNILIIHLSENEWVNAPEVLLKFLEDSSICFVGATAWPAPLVRDPFMRPMDTAKRGVAAGDLASKVLKNPTLYWMSLKDIADKVGVNYEPSPYVTSKGTELKNVDGRNPTGLTEEQIKAAVNDAYAYYTIGHKLLTSL